MKIIFVSFIALGLLFTACKDNNTTNPGTFVDITIHLNSPSYTGLKTVGSAVNVTGGLKGIVIYHKSLDEYTAFDRTCTYSTHTGTGCGVVDIESTSYLVKDKCCGSEYSIMDGNPVSTKNGTLRPLTPYQTSLDGDVLRVYSY